MADEYLTKSDIIDWIEDWTNKNPRLYDILNILWNGESLWTKKIHCQK